MGGFSGSRINPGDELFIRGVGVPKADEHASIHEASNPVGGAIALRRECDEGD
jgi:hypothetical protein